MFLSIKTGIQRLLTLDKNKFQSPETLESGTRIHHYLRESLAEKSRIHLRVDPDGNGTLIVNASSVMHLNPTATYMAWLTLERKTKEESISALRSRYSVSHQQAETDLASFL